MDIHGIIKRIPVLQGAGSIVAEPVEVGLTNRKFRLNVDGRAYFLRLNGDNTRHLGIFRSQEFAASRAVAEAGVAPRALAIIEPEGHLLFEFIEARAMGTEEFQSLEIRREIIGAARRAHSAAAIEGDYNPFRACETMMSNAFALGVAVPEGLDEINRGMRFVEEKLAGMNPRRCLCHNDLCGGNFMRNGQIWIVDWEFGGMGDPAFDLLTLAINLGIADDAGIKGMLEIYDCPEDATIVERMALMHLPIYLREVGWGMIQMAIAPPPTAKDAPPAFDYGNYVQQGLGHIRTLLEKLGITN